MADFRRRLVFTVDQRQLDKHRKDVGDYVRESDRSVNRLSAMWRRLGIAIAGAFSVAAISTFARSIVRLNADLEATETRLGAILGSTREARRLTQQFVEMSRSMTFGTGEIASAAQNLLLVGVAVEDLQDELMTLGDIASASGTSLDDMAETYGRNVARGYMSTNNVMTLIRRGIPIVEQLAETIGVTESEVWSMLSAREVSDRHLQETFQRMTAEGGMFFQMMQKEQDTLHGMISNLQQFREEMMRDIGAGLFESVRDDLGDLVKELEELRDSGQLRQWAERAGEGIKTFYQNVRAAIGFVREYGPAIARLTAVIAAFRVGVLAASAAKAGYAAITRTTMALVDAYRARTILASAAKAGLTGNIVGARAAMIGFNAAVRANPLGFLIGLLTSAVTAFMVFRSRTDEAAEGLKAIRDAARQAREEIENMDGAMLRARRSEIGGDRSDNLGQAQALHAEQRRIRGARPDTYGMTPAAARAARERWAIETGGAERLRDIQDELNKLHLERIELGRQEQQINHILETSIARRLEAHRAEREAIINQTRELTAAERERVDALDELIRADEKLLDQRRSAAEEAPEPPDVETYSRALAAVEAIRRAQQLAAQATEAQRDALREVFEAQDRIATLIEASQALGADAVAGELAAEQERLEAAQNRLRVEKDWEETIARAAEHWQEFQRLQLQPLQQMQGSDVQLGLNLQNAQKAVREYEQALTRLNNELASGAISQEDYARQVEAANLKALVAVKDAFNALRNAGMLTDELQDKFEEFFDAIRTGGETTTQTFTDLASTLQNLGTSIRSMTRLVDVFGDLNRQTRQFLDGLADMADGAGRFVQTWQALGDARGTAGGIMQLAVPGIGMAAGLASTISGLISSNREQKKEMERLSQSLRDAARQIRDSIEDMWRESTIGADVSQADISQAERSIRYLRSGMDFAGMEDALSRIEGTGIDFLTGIGDEFRQQVRGLEEQYKVGLRTGALTEQDIVRMAAGRVFGYDIDEALAKLSQDLGQSGRSIAGATRMFDLLIKAGVDVEDAWQDTASFILDSVEDIPDELRSWIEGLTDLDIDSDAFREEVQSMLARFAGGDLDLGAMSPRQFEDLIDFLLGIPSRISSSVDEGVSGIDAAFARLQTSQALTDRSQQELFDAFVEDIYKLDLGEQLSDRFSQILAGFDLDDEGEGAKQALLDYVSNAGELLADGMLDTGELTADQMQALLQVLKNFALGIEDVTAGLGLGIDGAVQGLHILTRLMGVDAPEALRRFVEMLGDAVDEIPAEARDLVAEAGALDLQSPEGRARLEEIVAAIGALMLATDDADTRSALQSIADGFQSILAMPTDAGEDMTSRSVQYMRSITEFQGNEIVLFLSSLDHWARRQLEQQEIMARSLVAMPAALSAAVAAAMQGSATYVDPSVIQHMNSSRTISVQIGDITRPLRDPDDIDYLVDAIADELRREMTRAY